MREILFKAKRKDGVGWVEGLPVKDAYGNWFIESLSGSNVFTNKITPETLCQFIGLTDNNGTNIFEGDTVLANTVKNEHYDDDHLKKEYQIAFENGTYCFYDEHGKVVQWSDGSNDWHSLENNWLIEVKGNIHDKN